MQHRIRSGANRRSVLARGAVLATIGAAVAATTAVGLNTLSLKSTAPALKNGGVPSGLSLGGGSAWFVYALGPGVVQMKSLSDGTPTLIAEDTSGLRLGDRPVDTAFDGSNLWIALDGAKAIARRRADGSYSRDVPTSGALKGSARHISTGQQLVTPGQSASVVWFTEPSTDTIGRATLSGDVATVKEYSPEGLRGFAPDMIVGLANGTAIATSAASPRIVRLTPGANDTLITSDVVWGGTTLPGGLAADRNSVVWFTQPTGGKVWRAFPNSNQAVEATSLTGLVQPGPIAVDSGNGIWIGDIGAKAIVRANSNAQRIPGTVSSANPTEIEVDGTGRGAVIWTIDGATVSRGTVARLSTAVVAVNDTSLSIRRGKPVKLSVNASEPVNLRVSFLRNGVACGTTERAAAAGAGVLTFGVPTSCVPKGKAAKNPVTYRLNLRAVDLDGNVTSAPRVSLVVKARAAKQATPK